MEPREGRRVETGSGRRELAVLVPLLGPQAWGGRVSGWGLLEVPRKEGAVEVGVQVGVGTAPGSRLTPVKLAAGARLRRSVPNICCGVS